MWKGCGKVGSLDPILGHILASSWMDRGPHRVTWPRRTCEQVIGMTGLARRSTMPAELARQAEPSRSPWPISDRGSGWRPERLLELEHDDPVVARVGEIEPAVVGELRGGLVTVLVGVARIAADVGDEERAVVGRSVRGGTDRRCQPSVPGPRSGPQRDTFDYRSWPEPV